LNQHAEAAFSMTGGFNFRKLDQPIDFFYKQREGVLCGDIFVPIFKSEISTTTPSLLFRKECLNVIGLFEETKPFSDINFILKLASRFRAVILYEPLLFRRLHDANDSGTNWISGYQQGIAMIKSNRQRLPSDVSHEALFKLYINFGEDCLLHEKRKKAIGNFFQAWLYTPFSLVPFRKIAKTISYWLINYNAYGVIGVSARPWKGDRPPKRVLAIRLQATGDVAITLPYLQHLRHSLPAETKLDFLTRKECADIPSNISLFNKVISIGGGRKLRNQLFHSVFLLPKVLLLNYDVVIDLQNNNLSTLIRKAIRPRAWSLFDRFSSRAAGERTRVTIEAVGLGKNGIRSDFTVKGNFDPSFMLKNSGWDGESEIVILNPAGAFTTRNWPLDNYVSFAELWLKQFPSAQFLILGTSFIREKADWLRGKLREKIITIIDQTTPSEAFAIVRRAKFILSEDSGLMHMAWVSGIPTLALFGSTRSDWSRPLGENSFFLDSSDLPCGNCMQETCRYGDVHCLTRYDAKVVLEYAKELIERKQISRHRTVSL
jgi:ADP-heptose:LPS heptosyltransferase